jgi:hypothetical protein
MGGTSSASATIASTNTSAPTVNVPKFVLPPAGLAPLDPALLNYQDSFRTSSMNTYNVTVNGAIDPIATARQINDILGREATTNGSFNNLGFSLLVAQ